MEWVELRTWPRLFELGFVLFILLFCCQFILIIYDRIVGHIHPCLQVRPYLGLAPFARTAGAGTQARPYAGPLYGHLAKEKELQQRKEAEVTSRAWWRPFAPVEHLLHDQATLQQRASVNERQRADPGGAGQPVPDARGEGGGYATPREPTQKWNDQLVKTLVDIESQKAIADRSIKARAKRKFQSMSFSHRGGTTPGSASSSSPQSAQVSHAPLKNEGVLISAAQERGSLRTPLDVQREREEGLRTLREAFVLFNARSQSGALSPEEVLRMLRAMLPDAPQMSTEDALNFIADNEHEYARVLSFDGFVRGVVALVLGGPDGGVTSNDSADIAEAARVAATASESQRGQRAILNAGLSGRQRELIREGMDEEEAERTVLRELSARAASGGATFGPGSSVDML